jgi:hypothetical protein
MIPEVSDKPAYILTTDDPRTKKPFLHGQKFCVRPRLSSEQSERVVH